MRLHMNLMEFRTVGCTRNCQRELARFRRFVDQKSVQQLLSTERHETNLARLKPRSSIRSQNLMLTCSRPHASDWLLAPPVPGLGLGLHRMSFVFYFSMCLFLARRAAVTAKLVLTKWT